MRVVLLLLVAIVLSVSASKGQCSELDIVNLRKIAIVFGEKDYKYVGPLTNPVNDAQDISDSLKRLGFSVYTYYNADIKTMTTAIDEWYSKLGKFDVALFYYSGHGAEVNGENYLFPVDANPKGISDLYYAAYSANRVLANMEIANSKVNIMILDACRNNPFKSLTRDIKSGLASMTGKGSFVGFAASPGNVALDGDKRNGFYTEAILKFVSVPNLTLDQIFTKVNSYVRDRSSGQQVPYKNSSLSSDFCFSTKNERSTISTKSTVIQPSSGILLASNAEKLFTSDSSNNSILVKDSRTLNNINAFVNGKIHPYKITTAGGGENCYVIDTLNQKLSVINVKKELLKSEVFLKEKPLGLIISNDEKKAYITNQLYASTSDINVIDLVQYKPIKQIHTNNRLQGLAISINGKYLYATSQCKTGNSSLYIIDTKTDKVIRSVEGIACGEAIGVLPNNKSIYVSSVAEGNIRQTSAIDINTLKIIKTVDFPSRSFSFTPDSKYVFALSELEVAIIRADDNTIVNKLPFATFPQGVAISDDGRAFVWLPKEHRTAVFSVSESTQNETPIDPETKLKNFKEEYNKKIALDDQYKLAENFEKIYWSYINATAQLSRELGTVYETTGGFTNPNYKDAVYTMDFGFQFKGDNTKRLIPKLIAKFTDNFLIVSMTDNGKEEIYKVSNRNIEWSKVQLFIRSFFLNNLDKLR